MDKEGENTATTKLKKARKKCCIEGCMKTPYHMVPGARYHEFPSNTEMFEKWLSNVRQGLEANIDVFDADQWMPLEKSVLCGQHFKSEDYREGTTRLFRTAVPTIFPLYDENLITISKAKDTKKKRKADVLEEGQAVIDVGDEPAFDLDDLCRLCCKPCPKNTVKLVQPSKKADRLLNMIKLCLPITVSYEDELPKRICAGCEFRLRDNYKFAKICKTSEETFVRMFKNRPNIFYDPDSQTQENIPPEKCSIGTIRFTDEPIQCELSQQEKDREKVTLIYTPSGEGPPGKVKVLQSSSSMQALKKNPKNYDVILIDKSYDSGAKTMTVSEKPSNVCDQCKKSFESTTQYTAHLEECEKVHGKGKKVRNKNLPDVYIPVKLDKKGNNIYECTQCKGTFFSEERCLSHMRFSHREWAKEQMEKQKSDRTLYVPEVILEDLNDDVQGVHKIPKETVKLNLLTLVDQLGRTRYLCKYCNGNFYSAKRCHMHIRKSHKGEFKELKVACTEQEKEVKIAKQQVKRSMKRIEKLKEKLKVAKTKPKSYLQRQMALKRKTLIEPCSTKCATCGKIFRTRQEMLTHAKRHTTLKNFMCDQCPLSFAVKTDLNNHMKMVHTVVKVRLLCDLCDCTFKFKKNVRDHMFEYHLEKYSYVCEVCKDSFKSRSHAHRHMTVHENFNTTFKKVYLHQCKLCNVIFDSKHNLKCHNRIVHKYIKRKYDQVPDIHTCEHCHKRFKIGANFQRHMEQKHRGMMEEREPMTIEIKDMLPTYECMVCTKKFQMPSSYKKHMTKHKITVILPVKEKKKRIRNRVGERNKLKEKKEQKAANIKPPKVKKPTQMETILLPQASQEQLDLKFEKETTQRQVIIKFNDDQQVEETPKDVPNPRVLVVEVEPRSQVADLMCQYCEKLFESVTQKDVHILEDHECFVVTIPTV